MKAKRIWLAAVIGIALVAAILFFALRPMAPPVIVGSYKFTLKSVQGYTRGHSRTLAEDLKEAHPDREVWVTIQADAVGAYREQRGYSPLSLYGPDIDLATVMRNVRLVTPNGKYVQPSASHPEPGQLPWDRLTGHSQTSTNLIVYEFKRPTNADEAAFTADIYTDTTPPNTEASPQAWPQAGALKFDSVHLP